jgi:hypothetical protein
MVYLCERRFLGATAADFLIITILRNVESGRFGNDSVYLTAALINDEGKR